ncbi:MAG: DUF1761 family protein, partial [Candidatus Eisenbacteria bacterium]|nr:DUF1761 family protein [Candidatus Latescibacterota bacterium]MBD3301203.1 DUF1761 family protein [Candidatus Eisenbacteria bacterium]
MPEMSQGVNYLAVLIGAVAYMVLGALWYSPVVFGKAWMRAIGKTAEQIQADAKPMNYVVAFIMSYVAGYGIARVMVWKGGDSVIDGVMIALVAGVCFVFASFVTNDRFENRPA